MEKSIYEIMKLIINFIKTKIFFPKARIIRFPFDIRGKKYIKYGRNFVKTKRRKNKNCQEHYNKIFWEMVE